MRFSPHYGPVKLISRSKSRGFPRTVKIHRPFTEVSWSIVTVVIQAYTYNKRALNYYSRNHLNAGQIFFLKKILALPQNAISLLVLFVFTVCFTFLSYSDIVLDKNVDPRIIFLISLRKSCTRRFK